MSPEKLYSDLMWDVHNFLGKWLFISVSLVPFCWNERDKTGHFLRPLPTAACYDTTGSLSCRCRARTTCLFSAPWRGASLLRAADPRVSQRRGNQEIHKSSFKQDINKGRRARRRNSRRGERKGNCPSPVFSPAATEQYAEWDKANKIKGINCSSNVSSAS